MRFAVISVAIATLVAAPAAARPVGPAEILDHPTRAAMTLIAHGRTARVLTDDADDPAVRHAAADLRDDLARVAGHGRMDDRLTIIVGTIGHNVMIDRLIARRRLAVATVRGRWEAFVQQVVDHPAPGVARALVIAGADPRGTAYGVYDLSARIGVSPWTWWADVPVRHADRLFVARGARIDFPRVKYRGIFLNDEAPALTGWAQATFGGVNHAFYARVFDLILRLKGNLLWPAMWGKAFYDDDAADKATAREYGLIVGTSHHEPMMRAHAEWARYGKGPWNYATNAPALRDFWQAGIERADGSDHLVTIGMRGDGDEPMAQGTAIPLLERIVADQRRIIADTTHRPAQETPQVWALYKEVQDYYDRGMRVPDDVTLLFSDDNWGNLRRLPAPGEQRPGGYGIYYHFDYVGGPRNYKWIDTTQIARVWDQMALARAHGADRLWIANVGDLKPLERPISAFLDFAWNPEAWPRERLPDYGRQWAAQQFGGAHAARIADILDRATRYAARRKFELLSPDTWSLTRDREAERVIAQYDALEADARAVGAMLPPTMADAYYELVLHDVEAAANLERLYVTVATNRLHAEQGRADTNRLADRTEALFAADRAIAKRYEALRGGKWVHMMDQTHIGYTSWQEPPTDVMPAVRRIALPAIAGLGIAVEGDPNGWTMDAPAPPGPLRFERFGRADRRIALFARGTLPVRFTARADADWLLLDADAGTVAENGLTLTARVDWARAPGGESRAVVAIDGSDGSHVLVPVVAVSHPTPPAGRYIEADDHVAIDAVHASVVDAGGVGWRVVAGLGRTGSAMEPFPQSAASQPIGRGPRLDYPVFLHRTGETVVNIVASPSLDTAGRRGLRYAVAIDDEAPQLVDLVADETPERWNRAVIEAARIGCTRHRIDRAGAHVVHVWMVDPGVSIQRLELTRHPVSGAALGFEESVRM